MFSLHPGHAEIWVLESRENAFFIATLIEL